MASGSKPGFFEIGIIKASFSQSGSGPSRKELLRIKCNKGKMWSSNEMRRECWIDSIAHDLADDCKITRRMLLIVQE